MARAGSILSDYSALFVAAAENKELSESVIYHDDKNGNRPFCDIFADLKVFHQSEEKDLFHGEGYEARGEEIEKLP